MVKNNHLKAIKQIYLCLLVIYTLLREVVILQNIIGHPLLTYGVFAFGLLLIGIDFFGEKLFLKARYCVGLILFLAICIITSLINMQHNILDNLKAISWMLLFFFLIYPSGAQNDSRQIQLVFGTFSITMTILMLLSVPMYFFDIGYTYYKINGTFTDQGFSFLYSRLWGVFQEANYAAIYAEIAGFMSCYFAVTSKKKSLTVIACLQCLLFLIFVVLSGSRTAKLVLLITVAWVSFYCVYCLFTRSKVKRICLSFCSPFLSIAIIIGLLEGLSFALPYAKAGVRTIVNQSTTDTIQEFYDTLYQWGDLDIVESGKEHIDNQPSANNPTDPQNPTPQKPTITVQPLDRTDLKNDTDISNGRFKRWKEGLQLFFKVPIFGTSPRGVSGVALKHLPESNIAKHQFSISNSYLEILIYTGVLGAIVLFGFLLLCAVLIIHKAIKEEFSSKVMFLHGMLLTVFLSAVLESDIFFVLTAGSISCWFVLGILMGQNQQRLFERRKK